ncbi:MAG: phosphate ABC transporter permease PstA [Thermoguttaceae bacterium]|jgi:phosphate transport system permease protein
MAAAAAAELEYFLLPAGGGSGAAGGPFASLAEAIGQLAHWSPQPGGAGGSWTSAATIDLAAVQRGDRPPPRGRPRQRYAVTRHAEGAGGDGTQLVPWWGTGTAAAGLAALERAGRVTLAQGQRLRLAYRDVFTATPLESRKKAKEIAARCLLGLVTLALVLPVVIILTVLVVKAWPALSPGFVIDNPQHNMRAGGIWAPLVGTFFLVLVTLLVAAPVGILAGVYLNEYARDNWLTRVINLAVMNLAGVPSIVYGLFGVGAFVLFARMGSCLLAAACTLAVMNLPVIITSTREALGAVPMAFREACWNLGATRWQTIRTIVLPNSVRGILTGVILEVARSAGETAPILFTGALLYADVPAHGWASFFPYGLTDGFMALSYHLFTLATQVQNVPEPVEYGTAVVLVGLVLAVNSLSIALRVWLRVRKKW